MISDNKKGNPYHDEDGKFTSGSGAGGSANPKSQKNEQFEFDVVTLDNKFLGTVQAGSEIEAFELASQKYPGYGDELDVLKVETKDKLEEMGFGDNLTDEQYAELYNKLEQGEKDINDFIGSHPHETVYDYDEKGNETGGEDYRFLNPEDQKVFDKLISDVAKIYFRLVGDEGGEK